MRFPFIYVRRGAFSLSHPAPRFCFAPLSITNSHFLKVTFLGADSLKRISPYYIKFNLLQAR